MPRIARRPSDLDKRRFVQRSFEIIAGKELMATYLVPFEVA
jgi:hypothetical protein